jgi:copper transport protein
VAALFATLAVPGGALAHARLVGSDPPDLCAGVSARIADSRCVTGVVVASPPLVIRLTFNEPVQPIGRGIRVVAPSGRRVERGPTRASGRDVSVDVDAAEHGTYVVRWRVVSGDAQSEQGRFAFSVGRPTATPALPPGDGRTASGSGFVLAVVGRALHFLGYALVFGSLAFRWLVLRPLGAPRVAALDRALWRLTRFGVVVLLLAEPLVVLGHAVRLGIAGDADVLADVLESRVGLVTGQRLGIALTLWAMLTALETGSSITLKLALALGIALAVIDGQAVHAASVRPLAAGLVTNALHVAAMGTWVGVVIALLVAWRVASVATLRGALAKRVGRVATIALLVAVGSGALLSFQHLTGTGDLATTAYGRVIVAKLATLTVVLALAIAARRGGGAPEAWWRGELAALVALLLLAAALVSMPPPT